MRQLLSALTVLMSLVSGPLLAQEPRQDDVRGYGRSLNIGLGRFEGEYGLSEETTFHMVNFNARWYLSRGQIQIGAPYLRLEGPGRVRLVGGQPVVTGEPDERHEESGLGDTVVQGEYYLRTGSTTSPWVIGRLRLKIPTGDEDKRLSTGAADVEIGLGLVRQYDSLTWLTDFGYTVVGSSSTFDLENVFRVGTGVSRSFGERTSGYLYLENRTNAVKGSNHRRSFIIGAERSLDEAQRLRLSVSMFVGLTEVTEDLGLYLNLSHRY